MKDTLRNFFRREFGHGSVEYWDYIIQLEGIGVRVDSEIKKVPAHYNGTSYQVDIRGDGFNHVRIHKGCGDTIGDRRKKYFFHITQKDIYLYEIHYRFCQSFRLGHNTSFRIAWRAIMTASNDNLLAVKEKYTSCTPGEYKIDPGTNYIYRDTICKPHIEVLDGLRKD